ncbi:MAG: thioredoxin-like domain-containing protein [Panacagrimonas sp.]
MNEALIVSQVILWVVVLALGIAVLALARQVGVLYERVAPAGALAMNASLKVGSRVPTMRVQTLAGTSLEVGAASERARLMFFLSPDCPVCKKLLPVLRSVARDERKAVELILASDGEIAEHREFVRKEHLEPYSYVLSETLGRTFGVSKLPYAVLLKEDGTIASFGIVNSREHLESLIEAKERGVASIQEYMSQAHDGHRHAQGANDHAKGVARAIS